MPPRVSLILPVRNGANFLAATLANLCQQSFADFELIVCDNASTDSTAEIVRSYALRDPRILYRRNAVNLGAAANYNAGFAQARGQYVKWCAHDDLISANFLTDCVVALDAHDDAVLAYGTTMRIDGEGQVSAFYPVPPDLRGLSPAQLYARMHGPCDTLIFGLWRTQTLHLSGLHRAYYGSDRSLLAEMALLGRFVHVPDAVFYNRDHPARSVYIADKRLRALWQATDRPNRLGLEHWPHLATLIAIAWRHRRVSPLPVSLYYLTRANLHPHQLSRYAIELVGLVSPDLQKVLREKAWAVLRRFRKPPNPAPQTPPADSHCEDRETVIL